MFYVTQKVDLEVFAEWVWLLDAAWVGGKNQVSELDAVLWEAGHGVEMEVWGEIGIVLLDHANDSDGGVVESLDCWWHGLSGNHVVLKESEYAYHQFFDGAPLLVECAVWSKRTHSTASLKAWKTEELLLTKHATSSHLLSTCPSWLGSQEMW